MKAVWKQVVKLVAKIARTRQHSSGDGALIIGAVHGDLKIYRAGAEVRILSNDEESEVMALVRQHRKQR